MVYLTNFTPGLEFNKGEFKYLKQLVWTLSNCSLDNPNIVFEKSLKVLKMSLLKEGVNIYLGMRDSSRLWGETLFGPESNTYCTLAIQNTLATA